MARSLVVFLATILTTHSQPNNFLVSLPRKVQFRVWIDILVKKKFATLRKICSLFLFYCQNFSLYSVYSFLFWRFVIVGVELNVSGSGR